MIDNNGFYWRKFCESADFGWYSSETETPGDDFALCAKDAKAGVPEAVKKLAEFAKFRMTQ